MSGKPIPEAALQAARVAYGSSMPDEERMRAALAAAVPHLTAAQQQGQAVAWSVLRIGNYGAAYDPRGACRAFTYDHQPGNVDAGRLGNAAQSAATASAGDSIDRGLALLKALQEAGFGVFQIGAAQPMQQGGGEDCDCPGEGKRDPLLHAPNCPARTAPPSAPVGVEGLLQRIDAAIERVTTGRAAMRIPADPTDPDLVLADAGNWIKQAAIAQQPAAVDEAAAILAFEEHFDASSDDPYFEGELELWLTAWRKAIATQHQEPTT